MKISKSHLTHVGNFIMRRWKVYMKSSIPILNPFININVALNCCLLTLKGFWIYRLIHVCDMFCKSFKFEFVSKVSDMCRNLLVRRSLWYICILHVPKNVWFLEFLFLNFSSQPCQNWNYQELFNINLMSLMWSFENL